MTAGGPLAIADSARVGTLDVVSEATIWNTLQTICREMRALIHHSGQSFLIAQSNDVSCGLWTADGTTVAVPAGIPPHFIAGKYSVQYILSEYAGSIREGDVFLSNDPYRGYTCHAPDWGFFRPIFVDGTLRFWAMCRTHMEDTGAAVPGGYFSDPYDVHAEGLLIPAVRIISEGQEQLDVMKLIWNNIRLPENVRIDSYAVIAATQFGDERVRRLVAKYGWNRVEAAIASTIERTREAARASILAMRDGTYLGESSTDDDGVVHDVPVTVRVSVTISGRDLSLDFSRSDPQQRGYVNATEQTTYSMALAGLTLFLGPELADHQNEGLMQAVTVINPSGRVTHSEYPAPCGGAPINVGHNIIEAVMMALSQACPSRAAAGWGRRYGQYIFGHRPTDGKFFVYPGYEAEGGAGAVYGYDGYQGTGSIGTLAEIVRPNTEDIETRYPWRIWRREFRLDSCGAGRWRGGAGFVWEAENLGGHSGMNTGAGQGETTFGHGALGGHPTSPNSCVVIRGSERMIAKVHRTHFLEHGDRILKETSGGGGVGSPLERDSEEVRKDVFVRELVSLAAAIDVYGVVIDQRTGVVDLKATEAVRRTRARGI